MIKLAKSADQKSFTSRAALHLAVNESMAALITKMKRPKVRIVAGRVSSLTNEPKMALIKPKGGRPRDKSQLHH